jgi:osmotically-inducible protein OsmY
MRAAGLAAAAAIGAVLAYFLDPDRGRSRRAETADRAAGLMRRGVRRLGRGVRYVGATASGIRRRTRHAGAAHERPNDATLAHKVESEVFRDPTISKGRMNVNAENGIVVLRGVAESQEQVERIIASTLAVNGVREVQSRLRTPADPPPGQTDEDELVFSGAGTAGDRRS